MKTLLADVIGPNLSQQVHWRNTHRGQGKQHLLHLHVASSQH